MLYISSRVYDDQKLINSTHFDEQLAASAGVAPKVRYVPHRPRESTRLHMVLRQTDPSSEAHDRGSRPQSHKEPACAELIPLRSSDSTHALTGFHGTILRPSEALRRYSRRRSMISLLTQARTRARHTDTPIPDSPPVDHEFASIARGCGPRAVRDRHRPSVTLAPSLDWRHNVQAQTCGSVLRICVFGYADRCNILSVERCIRHKRRRNAWG